MSRRHTHLTLEHLLYALAHDTEAERILAACGADLRELRSALDEFLGTLETAGRRERNGEPAQTLAFRRVLQTAVLHVQSAGKDEVRAGDILAAILQQPNAHARRGAGRAGDHPARRPQLHLARHRQGLAGRRRTRKGTERGRGRRGRGRSGRGPRSAAGLHGQPVGAVPGRRARSADRTGAGAAADAADSLPAAQEQPGVRRATRASARPRSRKGSRRG